MKIRWLHIRPAAILLALLCMVALRVAKGAVIGILLKLGLRRERV